MGLGLLGRGVGDVRFFSNCGAEVLVTDKKTEEELKESMDALKGCMNVTYHLGGHQESDFTNADLVVKAAGVRLDSPEVAAAKNAGVPIVMSTALFAKKAREAGAILVGVTGTRGKSTVTHMIFETLKKSGKKVHLGGNIRGLSTLELLPHIESGDICVLELDSWQLQGFGDMQISPDFSVFTNLMPDHQNYYKNMDEYFADKANIYRYQKEGGVIVAGALIAERIKEERGDVRVPEQLSREVHLKVLGEHNRENAALATALLQALGLSDEDIRSGLESFAGVEGRLQFVREVNLPRVAGGKAGGVKIYNDNNATTPEATIAALKALDTGAKNTILIMGGSDKGLDMSTLLYEVAKVCKRVVLLSGTGTNRIAPLMSDYSIFDSLEAAVQEAVKGASPGDVLLFSPAFASFGMFKNEYERNDIFLSIVRAL